MIKSYASYFVAYLLANIKDKANVERIILFGSVAKGEATKESDVDIFIETRKKTKKFEKDIIENEKNFYQSREAALFKVKGIENRIHIIIGKLSEWKDLSASIASTGIVLYGPFEGKKMPSGVKHKVIVFWDHIGKNRGSFLNKIYGFRVKNKKYTGLLEKAEGKKIGKSSIMLPIQYKKDIFKLLKEHRVRAKAIEVFT